MIIFIVFAILIVIACLVLIIRPLTSNTNTTVITREQQNIVFAQARLKELKEQLRDKKISSSAYQLLKDEIETTLSHDINLATKKEESNSIETTNDVLISDAATNSVLITLLCTLIPFGAISLYLITGTPSAINPNNLITQASLESPLTKGQDIDAMIAIVEQRLINQPEDLEGWLILTRSYTALGRYQEAIDANLQLLKIGGENPMIYAQLADTTALLAKGEITPTANDYINKALELDPKFPQALWLAGLSAVQNNDKEKAKTYWNTLLPLLDNSSQQQEELRTIISQLTDSQLINANNSIINSSNNAQQSTINHSELGIQDGALIINVSIDNSITNQVNQDDSVFVFAKAQAGPPAPLAVKRLKVSDLPTQIQLSDNDAMIEQFKISSFEEIIITARISKSGDPIAQNGDIESLPIITKNTNRSEIELVISNLIN